MKKFIEDSLEFVLKIYTFIAPTLYIVFVFAAVLISYYSGFNSLVGGILIALNVVHIILSTILLYKAEEFWDLNLSAALVNSSMILAMLGLSVWLSPMAITDSMSYAFVANIIFLLINTSITK